jgi:hypothetical protein
MLFGTYYVAASLRDVKLEVFRFANSRVSERRGYIQHNRHTISHSLR